ncbi:MAG: nucleoside triphosphate pyrophosphohydrolase [Ktedonobacterales bacterium]|nr:nucleoside triphosphate pyrophosphohydrolase [Ktedonobacterales bacterium]
MERAGAITIVGLGPGRWEDLTIAAQQVLSVADSVYFRTLRHPTVDALRARYPGLDAVSFDSLYEEAESFDTLYSTIVARLCERAIARGPAQPLIYAVPGHPLIGEESVRRLHAEAPEHGITLQLVAGLSYVEPVCAALGLDPLRHDLQLLDATSLAETSPAALMGALLPTRPALVAQVYNRRLASRVKLALSEIYPEEWEVALVGWAGLPEETITRVPLYALDRDDRADHLTTLYLPPLDPLDAVRVPEGLRTVTARLRAPDGCPWDREQTHQSLRRYIVEEAYEVAEVLDAWDGSAERAEQLAEELGDLLLQVYLQAEIGDEEELFSLGDIYQHITTKLIRRHPHVFGDVSVRDTAHVLRNWEAIKRAERQAKGEDTQVESVLRGVPKSAPALYQAYELGRKAAKTGFHWPDTQGAIEKVAEEARELAETVAHGEIAESQAELGDLLFTLARVADYLHLQPEEALHAANQRFRRRFEAMEARARAEGRALLSLSAEEWLAWWAAAKRATA